MVKRTPTTEVAVIVESAVIAEPQAFIRGRFSIYETPDGGFHIAAIFDGEDETRHTEIPGAMLKMAGMLGGGNPLSMLRSMFGGK